MATQLRIKDAAAARFDLVALGEVMLRLDPGEGRIHNTRRFDVWEGGGEYNVARGLRRCFGLRTAIVTALADNPVGRLVEDLMLQGGVDLSFLRWLPYDGVGRELRNGLNFVERGFGPRGGVGCSDRGHTAIAQLLPGDVDWQALFARDGARWFHTGGVFCALSETTPSTAEAAAGRLALDHSEALPRLAPEVGEAEKVEAPVVVLRRILVVPPRAEVVEPRLGGVEAQAVLSESLRKHFHHLSRVRFQLEDHHGIVGKADQMAVDTRRAVLPRAKEGLAQKLHVDVVSQAQKRPLRRFSRQFRYPLQFR